MQVAAGRGVGRVKVGVRVEPEHEERPAELVGAAREAGQGSGREAVVAAEEDRHGSVRGGIGGFRQRLGPGGYLGQRLEHRVAVDDGARRRCCYVAEVTDAMAEPGDGGVESGGAQRARAHLATRSASTVLNRGADEAAVSGSVGDLCHPGNGADAVGKVEMEDWRNFQYDLPYRRNGWADWYMDVLDERLVTLLRHDARRSISDLSAEVGVSRATVRARIERLERAREILGYTVILRSDAVDLPVRGIMLIEIGGHVTERVVRALGGYPEVSAIHTTNGRWDLVVELGAGSLSDLDAVLRRIRLIGGVTNSETHLLLATPRSTRARL